MEPSQKRECNRDLKKGNWRLFGFVRPCKRYVAGIIFFMVIFSVTQLGSLGIVVPIIDNVFPSEGTVMPIFDIPLEGRGDPGFLTRGRMAINDVMTGMSPQAALKWIALLLIVLTILKGFAGFFKNYLTSRMGQKVILDIRNTVYAHLQHLSLHFYSQAKTGEMISHFTNDIALIQTGITKGICEAIVHPIMIASYVVGLFLCEPRLAAWSLIFLPLLMVPLIKMSRRLKRIGRSWQEQLGGLATILHETITGVRIVKAFAMENYEIERFRKENRKLFRVFMGFEKRKHVLPPLMTLIGAMGVGLMLIYGGGMVIDGRLTQGKFILFIALLIHVLKPLQQFGKISPVVQMMLAASDRVYQILDTPLQIATRTGAKVLGHFERCIEWQDVSFRYGQGHGDRTKSKLVLDHISLSVQRGEVVAFVGSSGAGKTTILNLLPRFYDVSSGKILLDGVDLRDIDVSSLRSLMGIVTQETILFNDTVAGNITYGRSHWNQEDLVRAARQAQAHDFIMHMPQAYDTVVGERGVKLSGGQRQRLAIARALMKDPPILILDEATSALDSESEQLVQRAIEELMKGRTVFAVAHRLSTIVHANRIFVLDQGRIIDAGTHHELLKRSAVYQKMHKIQAL